jgi:hypothetical protein
MLTIYVAILGYNVNIIEISWRDYNGNSVATDSEKCTVRCIFFIQNLE